MKYCVKCGAQVPDESTFCPACGTKVQTVSDQAADQASAQTSSNVTYNVNVAPEPCPVAKKNGLGVAGFVLGLIGFIICWIPVAGIIPGGLGLIFSVIALILGICKKLPIGLSITGLILGAIACIGNLLVLNQIINVL